MLSIPHLIVIFIVVLVVFGPKKLPELARGLGKLMAELRKASSDFRLAFDEEMRDLERQAHEAERKLEEQPVLPSPAPKERHLAGEPQTGDPAETHSSPAGPSASASATESADEKAIDDQRQPV